MQITCTIHMFARMLTTQLTGGSSLATYSGPILVELLCNIYVKCSLVCMKTLLVTPGVSLFLCQSFYGMNLDETPPCEVIYRCHKQDERDF